MEELLDRYRGLKFFAGNTKISEGQRLDIEGRIEMRITQAVRSKLAELARLAAEEEADDDEEEEEDDSDDVALISYGTSALAARGGGGDGFAPQGATPGYEEEGEEEEEEEEESQIFLPRSNKVGSFAVLCVWCVCGACRLHGMSCIACVQPATVHAVY